MGDTLRVVGTSRAEILREFAVRPCTCGGSWRQFAEWSLAPNHVAAADLCSLVLQSHIHGRHESLSVVALMGKQGGEGKFFFLSPLRSMFGHQHVQPTPQPGAFPLLGLETKRLAILDEWDFDERTLSLSPSSSCGSRARPSRSRARRTRTIRATFSIRARLLSSLHARRSTWGRSLLLAIEPSQPGRPASTRCSCAGSASSTSRSA